MSAPDDPRGDAPASPAPPPDLPRPAIARRAHYSLWLVWLVPLVAVVIGVYLGARSILNRGPTITIYFHNAEGIEAGKTHLKYKDVDVGLVRRVRLTPDHRQVEVVAEMHGNSGIEDMLVSDTRFWVVRPRVGAAGVSGLNTVLSGAYIGMDAGRDTTEKREFNGLDTQPAITADVPGREFTLIAEDLGSLDIGSPIYLRRVPVGQVLAYTMMPDGRHIQFSIFVTAPYDRFVNVHSRFWHASGIDIDLGAQGLRVQTQSVVSVLAGGVAFQDLPDPDNATPGAPPEAAAHTPFTLYAQMADALKLPDSQGFDYRLLFDHSVRGLAVGAPVEYRGLPIGEVTRIAVDGSGGRADPEPMIAVDVRVYPRRLPTIQAPGHEDTSLGDQRRRLDPMIQRGLRAQLKSASLLTGQLFVSLDFVKRAPAAHIAWGASPPILPTAPGDLDSLQDSLASLAAKLNAIPFDQLGGDLHRDLTDLDSSLRHADALMQHLDSDVVPGAKDTLADARKAVEELRQTLGTVDQTVGPKTTHALGEVAKAAAAFKALADELKRHPESLLKGKPEDPQ